MDDFATMGRRVRERRLRFNLSVRELAERSGVSRNTLVRLEAGQSIAAASAEKIRIGLSMFTDQIELPIAETPFSVHRFPESRWTANAPKTNYRRLGEGDDPRHEDDPGERRRLGTLGFQACFTAVLNSEFPDGVGSHSIMEIHGETKPTRHYGEEFIFCMRGSVTVQIEGATCVLNEWDTMCFDATRSHTYLPSSPLGPNDLPPLLLVVVSMRPGEQPLT
jgi:transcriptional regulator with XRE-family HTH domain